MAAVRWSVSKAMDKWGVGRTTVLRWLREGRVPGERRDSIRGPVWFVLDSDRPQPSVAPIGFRARVQPGTEAEPAVAEMSDDSDFSDLEEPGDDF